MTAHHGGEAGHRLSSRIVTDGQIEETKYGSSWSFKLPHMDSEALLFSHHYCDPQGFSGGELLLLDSQHIMASERFTFDDFCDWSTEMSGPSKPVIKAQHAALVAERSLNLGAPGSDMIVFVNNAPSSGIFHAVTGIATAASDEFRRAYHRCSVKAVSVEVES
jgi:hypothetical protein